LTRDWKRLEEKYSTMMLLTGEVWRIPWQQSSLDTRCGMVIDRSTFGEKRKRNTFSSLVKISMLSEYHEPDRSTERVSDIELN